MSDYMPPAQLAGVTQRGGPVLLTAEQTRMVYVMLGLTEATDGDTMWVNASLLAKYFWFNAKGYGKTTTLLTAARYAEAAQFFWWNGYHLDDPRLDVVFLDWYCNEAEHL